MIRVKTMHKNCCIAISPTGDTMAVSNSHAHCVMLYDLPSGDEIRCIGTRGDAPGRFHDPSGVCFLSNGNLLVAECENKRLQEVTCGGEHVRFIGADSLASGVTRVAATDDVFVVTRYGRVWEGTTDVQPIVVFDAHSGNIIRQFGPPVESATRVTWVECRSVRITPDGNHIVVAEILRDRVLVFTLTGEIVRQVSTSVEFRPKDALMCSNGEIVVVGAHSSKGLIFSPSGSIRVSRVGEVDLNVPTAVELSRGFVFILDSSRGTVNIYG
jgi:DNA-binding beta-propeller fold protein YncE